MNTFFEKDTGAYDKVCHSTSCYNNDSFCEKGRGFDCFGEHFKNKGYTYRHGTMLVNEKERR